MKANKHLLFLVLTLLGGYFVYDGIIHFVYIVFDSVNSITEHYLSVIPFFISGIIYLLNYFFYLGHYYIKERSKKHTLVVSIITFVLSLLFYVIYFMRIGRYFANLKYDANANVFFSFIMVSGVATLDILALYKREMVLKEVETRELEGLPKSRYILSIVFSIFAYYALGCFYVSFIAIRNYGVNFFGYLVLVLFFLTLVFDEVYLLGKDKLPKIMPQINLCVNAFMVLLFFLTELLSPDFIVEVGKPFAPVDFAVSMPILPLILLISATSFTIYGIVKVTKELIDLKKNRK